MNKLRLHFTIFILCCFSFLLMTGTHVFKKVKADLNAYERPVIEVKENRMDKLENIKEFKKISSLEEESSAVKNGRMK